MTTTPPLSPSLVGTLPRPPTAVRTSTSSRVVALPDAPLTASPVPELTSLYSRVGRGPYGDARYRGNCSGYLIRDLIRYFGSQCVLDLMRGSGTCGDVCRELGIPFAEMDLRLGQDAANPDCYAGLDPVGFVCPIGMRRKNGAIQCTGGAMGCSADNCCNYVFPENLNFMARIIFLQFLGV